MIRVLVFFVISFSLWARPSVLRVVHQFPLGALCDGWSNDGGVAWLVDKKKGLFVACHGAPHFGVVSHSLSHVELFPEEGPSLRCNVVYADWANRVSLLEVCEEDKPFLEKLSAATVVERLCARSEKVSVATLVNTAPLFFVWQETEVMDPWVVTRGSPQMFAIPHKNTYAKGTPILDQRGQVLGVVVDNDGGRTLVVQGRHIAYTLEKWYAGQRDAPGFLCGWDFETNKPDFNTLTGGSTNGLVVADWGPETLQDRDYYGCVDLAGLDDKFKTFRGYDVQQKRHLGVYRTNRLLNSGPNIPIVGDVIWAAWEGDHEVELYGDPLKLLRLIDKARNNNKDFMEWTVLRKDKSYKVRVALTKGVPATEVVMFGNLACSNEVVPGFDGIVGVHPRWKEAAFFIESIDGVSVKTIDDVKQVLKKAGALIGVSAFHRTLQGCDILHGVNLFENAESIILYQMAPLLAQVRVFKKEEGVWHERAC